jgi:hypothetical protein
LKAQFVPFSLLFPLNLVLTASCCRLDAAQRSHSTGYGKLTEHKVEKDLIATTAYVPRRASSPSLKIC